MRGMELTPLDDLAPEDAHDDEAGQGMVEYALIVILVAVGALIALQVLGHATNNLYSNIQTALPAH
jgi:Flp pilus assembly pilin Flp